MLARSGARWVVAAMLAVAGAALAGVTEPQLRNIGGEETLGAFSGSRPEIAVDSKGQPHVVVDSGMSSVMYFYDKIGSSWQATPFSIKTYNPSSATVFRPCIDIDQNDVAFYGMIAFTFKNEGGCWYGLGVRQNIATAPSRLYFSKHSVSSIAWDPAQMSLVRPEAAGTASRIVVHTFNGDWSMFQYDTSSAGLLKKVKTGNLFAGYGGEKISFEINAAGVWHAAAVGYSKWNSSYQNSRRQAAGQGVVTFANYSRAPIQGSDDIYVGVGVDNANPNAAYLAMDLGGQGGVCINIFDGSKMLYSPATLKTVDSGGTSGEGRFPPQWTPAKDGGAFLCWTSGSGKIMLQWFSDDGSSGPRREICSGFRGGLCTDKDGDLHLAYMRSGSMRYRKLAMSSAGLRQVGPTGKTTDTTPTFSWQDSPGSSAVQYRLWVHRNGANYAQAPVTYINVPATSYTYPGEFDVANYQWWIQTTTNANQPGIEWVGPMTFSIAPPKTTLIYPVGNEKIYEASDLRLTWRQSAGANKYNLWISRNGAQFKTVDIAGGGSTNWVPGDIATAWKPGSYKWWIRGSFDDAGGTVGDVEGYWSDMGEFSIAGPPAPVIAAPAAGSETSCTSALTIAWSVSPGATRYKIWVDKNDMNPWKAQWIQGGSVTQWVVNPVEFDPAIYQVWVKGVSDDWAEEAEGPYSRGVAFARLREMTPGRGETVTALRPLFQWSGTAGSTWYEIWLNRNAVKFHSQWLQGGATTWTPDFDMPAGGYRWWVRSWSPDAGYGPWLNQAGFTIPVRKPGPATPVSPLNVVVETVTPTYKWQAVQNSSWYRLLVQNEGREIHDRWYKAPVTEVTPAAPVGPGEMNWWVQTYNLDGEGPWSAKGVFYYRQVMIVSPTGGVTVASARPTLIWSPIGDATSYSLHVKRNGLTHYTGTVAAPASNWTPGVDWPAGNYEFWVQSHHGAVNGRWSDAATFKLSPP